MVKGAGQRRGKRLALLGCAIAAGVACGTAAQSTKSSSLAPAGSSRDDGSGMLARASASLHRKGDGGGYGGAGYTTGNWASYGAGAYGGGAYGGGLYANYKFAQQLPHDPDVAVYAGNYVVDETLKTGRIVGTVKWSTKPKRDRIGPPACESELGTAQAAPENAVVFLRKIKRGRGFPVLEGYPTRRWQVGGTLRVEGCKITPYTQVVGPIGGVIRAVLADDGPDRVTERDASSPLTPLKQERNFEATFTSRGDERISQIRKPGIALLTNRRGALAWVMTADHPYYVVLDPGGSFALLDVPVGSYELVAWHPPVKLPSGKLSKPFEVTRKVTVRAKKKTRAALKLPRPRQ